MISVKKSSLILQDPRIVYGKCYRISNTLLFLFSSKLVVISAGTNKFHVRIAKREHPDQTASSDQGLHCLSMPFGQKISV